MASVRGRMAWVWVALACIAMGGQVQAAKTYTFKTKHYVIETTVSPDFAAEMGELMEILHAGYSKFFTNRPRGKGMSRVVIYKTRAEYMSVGEGMANSGGYFSPRDDKIVSWLEGHENYLRNQVLAHEGFHQFFAKCIGTSGPWINEGLAELFAYSLIDGTDIKFGLVTTRDILGLKKAMSSAKKLSMEELLTMNSRDWSSNLASDAELGHCQYAQSRFLVHFLRHADEGKYASCLDRYIKAIQGGKDGIPALKAGFASKLADINEAFPKWIDEDLKPECPESCSANLFHLAQLVYQFKKAGVEFGTIEELKEKVKSNKDVKWRVIPITLNTEKLYGPEDMDIVEKWFVCPKCAADKKRTEYELVDDPDPPEEGLPMILCCAHHKKLAICASFRKAQGSSAKGGVWPEVRNTQIKILRKAIDDKKKGKKD